MTEPSYTVTDALLRVSVAVEQLLREFERVRDATPDTRTAREFADYAIPRVERLFLGISEHQNRFGAHADHYSTGVPVVTNVEVADGWRWRKVWHPEPSDPRNQPRELVNGIPLPDGSTATVICSGPGVLDVVRHKPAAAG